MKCLVTVVIQGKMEEPSGREFSFFHCAESGSGSTGPPTAGGEGQGGAECVGLCEIFPGKDCERTFCESAGSQRQPCSQVFPDLKILFSRNDKKEGQFHNNTAV